MKKKIMVITSLSVIIVGVILIVFIMNGNKKLDLVIGDEKIQKEEFLQAVSKEKYGVTQHFYKNYGAEVDSDFWEQQYDGELPYKMVTENAIDSLKYIHATYGIAKEKGYVEAINYNDLIQRFEQENQMRAEKIKNGEPVYGLAEFTLDLYLEYEMDGLQKMYTNDLDNEGMTIPEEEAKSYYHANKDKMFVKHDDITIEFIKIYYAALELGQSEVDMLKSDLMNLSKNLTDNKTIQSLLPNYPSLESYYKDIEILSGEVSARAKEMGDVLQLAEGLAIGNSTQVIDQNGSLYLIRCKDRVDYDYTPYDLVRDNVLKILREEKYNQIVKEKVKQLNVQGNMDEIYAFTKEQLNQ
ncbi:hypothetical protein BN1058_01551 [Paraliobacillus sp. PM-2]|uniref:hypothetical protein n=1 Tax=Paraliobacillus sp. PM-2 TaxID=1462524 RepID=UPI00061BBF3A|nr:hypothetical protein [Paraliobacillus sp. PM-2]CQR47244.1 hypothetical protein BN1058_01551 [Paraliobacillus sp. PM-2]